MDFLQTLKDKADSGDVHAQCMLALGYQHGWGIDCKDPECAFQYAKMAADNGVADCACEVAHMYYLGTGTAQDYDQAFKYFKQAADASHLAAHYTLGMMYAQGQGCTQDLDKARECFQVLANVQFPQAAAALEFLNTL